LKTKRNNKPLFTILASNDVKKVEVHANGWYLPYDISDKCFIFTNGATYENLQELMNDLTDACPKAKKVVSDYIDVTIEELFLK